MIVKVGQKVQLSDGRIIHVRDAVDHEHTHVKENPDDIFMGHVDTRLPNGLGWKHHLKDHGLFYFSDVVAIVE